MSESTPQYQFNTSGQSTFSVEIIWPDKKGWLNVYWIEINSPSGHFIIGPNHKNLISLITPFSALTYQSSDNIQSSIPTTRDSVVIVSEDKVTIIMG